ncbi:MAG: CofH family radical SAM protein, partial [Thermodesulfobacteriota bacterium]
MNALKKKIYEGQRISAAEALDLFRWPIIELGMAADFRRGLVRPGDKVGFIIDRIVNFTNICEASCAFCAFHARAGRVEPYELSLDEILEKVEALALAGGSQVMLQGGLHPQHTLDTFLTMVRAVKKRFPAIALHSFSPAELIHITRRTGITLDEALQNLREAGLDSVPGASDLLVDRIRDRISPNKPSRDDWCRVMDALGRHGLKSSATMTYGMGETPADRIHHLETVRAVQDRTGIVRAFIPWSFSPGHTLLADVPPATGIDYLRVVAVSRIFLDNVIHLQAGWLTEGMKLAQIALTMGADDMGGVLTEE